ncbi:MAG: DUF192 domain-containing protein [Acidobacteria bacterium]|nr:DUF192 domain-containing protein [Acidobacteriota bacterium]
MLLGCGGGAATTGEASSSPAAWEPEGRVIPLTLPGDVELQVELRQSPDDQARGMMFRPQLPPDKGMLFVFDRQQPRPFWMFQTMVPLDMIWFDDNKRVVEIQQNAPPCGQRDFRNCPTYGGNQPSTYVLELAAGRAAAYDLKVGDQVEF